MFIFYFSKLNFLSVRPQRPDCRPPRLAASCSGSHGPLSGGGRRRAGDCHSWAAWGDRWLGKTRQESQSGDRDEVGLTRYLVENKVG